jgi:hypothetical protein
MAPAERPDQPGARRVANVIVSTGELSTSEDPNISAYVRASITERPATLGQCRVAKNLSF